MPDDEVFSSLPLVCGSTKFHGKSNPKAYRLFKESRCLFGEEVGPNFFYMLVQSVSGKTVQSSVELIPEHPIRVMPGGDFIIQIHHLLSSFR